MLYTNENFPLPVILALSSLVYDVLTSSEAGNANQSVPDEGVIAFANRENRILLTPNRKHFIKLHQANPDHSGIITCTFDPDFGGAANRISKVIQDIEPMAGILIRVNRP